MEHLLAHHVSRLGHGGILLLEPLTKTLRALEELVDTAHDAAFLLGVDLGRGEVIDTVFKALLNEVGVHLEERSASYCL